MSYLDYYMEDKKEDIKKKWKILQFLEDQDFESEFVESAEIIHDKESDK